MSDGGMFYSVYTSCTSTLSGFGGYIHVGCLDIGSLGLDAMKGEFQLG